MRRIIIADDHPVVRQGLKQIISRHTEPIEIDESGDGADLLRKLKTRNYDLVLLDIVMPGRNGFEILGEIREACPRVPVLIVSTYPEEQLAIRAIKAGASGYINKESAPEVLLSAIDHILGGRIYVSQEVAELMALDLRGARGANPHDRLSDREFEIFILIGKGVQPVEIARRLNLSIKTISTHRANILEKTGFQSNAEIMRYVIGNGLG